MIAFSLRLYIRYHGLRKIHRTGLAISRKPKILIVDDEDDIRQLFQMFSRRAKYECLTANDGKRGLEAFQNTPGIDCVITDVMMPYMDGFELTTEIKKIAPNMPVFIITGFAPDSREKALEVGAEALYCKPLEFQPFLKTVLARIEEIAATSEAS